MCLTAPWKNLVRNTKVEIGFIRKKKSFPQKLYCFSERKKMLLLIFFYPDYAHSSLKNYFIMKKHIYKCLISLNLLSCFINVHLCLFWPPTILRHKTTGYLHLWLGYSWLLKDVGNFLTLTFSRFVAGRNKFYKCLQQNMMLDSYAVIKSSLIYTMSLARRSCHLLWILTRSTER